MDDEEELARQIADLEKLLETMKGPDAPSVVLIPDWLWEPLAEAGCEVGLLDDSGVFHKVRPASS